MSVQDVALYLSTQSPETSSTTDIWAEAQRVTRESLMPDPTVWIDETLQFSVTETWEHHCQKPWSGHNWGEWYELPITKLFVDQWGKKCLDCGRVKTRDWIRYDLIEKMKSL